MIAPHAYWQEIAPAETDTVPVAGPFAESFPARLPDGRRLMLPIRVLPGAGDRAVASLILNQASFAVLDALAAMAAELLAPLAPEVIAGVPTLGLTLAEAVARRLGHSRLVALGTSRKFWYRDELSVPLSSITTPEQDKRLFLDPRLLPLLEGRRVAVVDDVVSSGRSLRATLALLRAVNVTPVGVGVAMLQGERWQDALAADDATWPGLVRGVFASPLLRRTEDGWVPE